jgi:hypothetical protein
MKGYGKCDEIASHQPADSSIPLRSTRNDGAE